VALRPGLSALALAAAALAGCGSLPTAGTTVTVAISRLLDARDIARLKPAERANLQAAGIGATEVAAGRVARVHCAVMTDGWWDALAVLPSGSRAGTVVRMQVTDAGDNERLGVNRVAADARLDLPADLPAYRAIPDWREAGRRDNFERIPLPAGLEGRYSIVHGSWLVNCRP
jgi:hypothetical protein